MDKGTVIGIDATNIRGGGGSTHLIELLNALKPKELGIQKVVIWAGASTVSLLPAKSWLTIINPKMLNKGLFKRTIWQVMCLSQAVRESACDVLFVPGGSYSGSFSPVVTMSQNLLPFENLELRRFGISWTALKYLLLRYTQTKSMKQSQGVIFLTEYARNSVQKYTGALSNTVLIPHGISKNFFTEPKKQFNINHYSVERPLKILYVSIVNEYKHQWNVVSAVSMLREQSRYPLALSLVGPSTVSAGKRIKRAIDRYDFSRQWVKYDGPVDHDILVNYYMDADLAVFASSCENLPIILLEKMAAGLPIACSNKGPMPEVLGAVNFYFNPEDPKAIASVIGEMISSEKERYQVSLSNHNKAQLYSWDSCAFETFKFLVKTAND